MSVSPGQGEAPPPLPSPRAFAPRRLHSDIAIAIVIVAFCAVVYGITTTFPSMPSVLVMDMGPEVFPRLLLGVLVFLAGLLAFISRGRRDESRESVPAMVYWTALAMLAFIGVVWLVGMTVAMFVGFVGIGLLWGEKRRGILLVAGVALSAFIYLLFVRGFGIPLPRGLVGEWLF
jgi:putative tricarboxylic transport membrane protein